MPFYTEITGLTSLTFFLTGFFVYSRDTKRVLYRRCFIFSASVALWAAGYYVTLLSIPNYTINLIASRLSHACGALIPITYLHFVLEILHVRGNRKFLISAYIFSIAMFMAALTSLVVRVLLPKMGIRYYPEWGPLYPLYSAMFICFPGYAQYAMARAIMHSKGTERTRLIYFFVALALAFSGGISLFLLVFNLQFPPYFSVLIILYPPMMAYTILVHKFLDIEVIIRRTIIFAGLASFIFGVFALVTFLVQDVLNAYVHTGRFTITFISVFLIVFSYEPLRKFLVDITDRFLFQKKYDYHKLLKENAKQIAFIHSLDEIAKQVSAYLVKQGRIKNAGILMRNDQKAFELKYPLGYGGKKNRPQMILSESHQLINLLKIQNGPVSLGDLESLAKDQKIDITPHRQALEVMRRLKAEVLIPSFLGRVGNGKNSVERELSNIIVLGSKKSDEPYTDEDLDVFFTVAQESAIAAENARLVSDLVLEREEKIKAQKTAELVNYTRTFKHEGGNALVAVESAAINMRNHVTDRLTKLKNQIQTRLSETETRLFDSIHNLVVKNATEIEHAGQKMGMIMDTVVGALSADESMKQEVYFRIPWETAKRNAKIEYDFRFDVKTPERFRIYGNTILLERVFQNFFTNSRDAITNSADKLIFLNGSYREHEGKQVTWFEYWDAGPGIPETLFEKVFEQGFSTKAKPLSATSIESGHGYGLYVCRKYIEELHGGKIWLEKNEATGRSKFVFWLPFLELEETDGSK